MGSVGDLYLNGKVSTYSRNVVSAYVTCTIGSSGAITASAGDTTVFTVARTGTGAYTATFVGSFSHFRGAEVIQVQASPVNTSVVLTGTNASAGTVSWIFLDKTNAAADPASGDTFTANIEVDCVLP